MSCGLFWKKFREIQSEIWMLDEGWRLLEIIVWESRHHLISAGAQSFINHRSNKEPIVVHHLCHHEKAEEPGVKERRKISPPAGVQTQGQTIWKCKVTCHKIFGEHQRSRRLLPIWRRILIFLLCCTSVTDSLTFCVVFSFYLIMIRLYSEDS